MAITKSGTYYFSISKGVARATQARPVSYLKNVTTSIQRTESLCVYYSE